MLPKAYHQLRRPTETAGHKPDTARAIAREVCALHAVLVSVLVCACSSKVQHPPELGNCQAPGDASCFPSLSAGGAVSEPHQGGGNGDAMDHSGDDGGPCGTAHNGVTTQNPECVPCILQACCLSDKICSDDLVCRALVSSAFPGPGTPMCQSQTSPDSCMNFLSFAQCVATCPSCPTLTLSDF